MRQQTPAPKYTVLGVRFYGEVGHSPYQFLLQVTRDEARRIAVNIAKLPELLRKP